MAKINHSFRLFPGTAKELKALVARQYGKNATQAVELAIHAAYVATAETKPKK